MGGLSYAASPSTQVGDSILLEQRECETGDKVGMQC